MRRCGSRCNVKLNPKNFRCPASPPHSSRGSPRTSFTSSRKICCRSHTDVSACPSTVASGGAPFAGAPDCPKQKQKIRNRKQETGKQKQEKTKKAKKLRVSSLFQSFVAGIGRLSQAEINLLAAEILLSSVRNRHRGTITRSPLPHNRRCVSAYGGAEGYAWPSNKRGTPSEYAGRGTTPILESLACLIAAERLPAGSVEACVRVRLIVWRKIGNVPGWPTHDRSLPDRFDEFPAGYSSAGCAPAEPASCLRFTGKLYFAGGERSPGNSGGS